MFSLSLGYTFGVDGWMKTSWRGIVMKKHSHTSSRSKRTFWKLLKMIHYILGQHQGLKGLHLGLTWSSSATDSCNNMRSAHCNTQWWTNGMICCRQTQYDTTQDSWHCLMLPVTGCCRLTRRPGYEEDRAKPKQIVGQKHKSCTKTSREITCIIITLG